MQKNPQRHHMLMQDALYIIVSLLAAVLVIQLRVVDRVFEISSFSVPVASFLAGIFFTSIFTAAPAATVLAVLAGEGSGLIPVAFWGALGSLLGDMFIFRFVRDNVSHDFSFIFSAIKKKQRQMQEHHQWHRLHAFRYIVPLLGALIIISPLPDEIGISLLALSNIRIRHMIPITFALNFIGILVICEVSRLFV